MTKPLSTSTIGFLGGGNMAAALVKGILEAKVVPPERVMVSDVKADRLAWLKQTHGVTTTQDNHQLVKASDVVVLAVKPQVLRVVCTALASASAARPPLWVSIAAGIRIAQIDAWLGGGQRIVRCMPNTPALIGAGATGLYANAAATADDRAVAQALLGSAGLAAWVDDEAQMDVVTALSGSGPAYFFLLVELLEDAAVAGGLPRETARALAVQTCLGAARMAAEDGETPTRLRERVTSPGGTTQAALTALIDGGLPDLVATAINAATRRGAELSAQYS